MNDLTGTRTQEFDPRPKNSIPLAIEIIFHYPEDDEKCNGDYYEADLVIGGETAWALSDEYHDSPRDKFKGFLKALDYLDIPYTKQEIGRNDSKY